MDINSLDYRNLTEKFGLVPMDEERLEKVLAFLEKNGKTKAFKTLICGVFLREQHNDNYHGEPDVSKEFFLHAITTGMVRISELTRHTSWMIGYLSDIGISEGIEQRQFALKYDKEFYKQLIQTELTASDDDIPPIDYDVDMGYVNLNTMSEKYRVAALHGAENPAKMLKKLSPLKKVQTAVAYAKSGKDNEETLKVCLPQIKIYFTQLLELDDRAKIVGLAASVLNQPNMREYASVFCPFIKVAIDRYNLADTFPFNLPRFKGCHRKYKHLAKFDFVTSSDEWGQHIIEINDKFGVADSKGNVIIQPQYESIGIPKNGVRIAIGRDREGYRKKLFKFDQKGQEITA
jgi:hypothetical protein